MTLQSAACGRTSPIPFPSNIDPGPARGTPGLEEADHKRPICRDCPHIVHSPARGGRAGSENVLFTAYNDARVATPCQEILSGYRVGIER
jgi:hypothetical protein